MKDAADDAVEIRETDIVFDCPHCGKSLAIDYRGAGLTIPCSDCGKRCVVPIPEGMQIGDIDRSVEDQEVQILNLRKSIVAAKGRISDMEGEIGELKQRRRALEDARTSSIQRMALISEQIGVLKQALKAMAEACDKIEVQLQSNA